MPNLKDLIRRIHTSSSKRLPFRLPQELVDLIVSYIYDINTLISCTMACSSLYYAATPHLHYSFKITYARSSKGPDIWLKPFQGSYDHQLLSHVKRFNLTHHSKDTGITPVLLDGLFHNYSLALKNLRELRIDGLDLFSCMPNIKSYFGHFAPTLQSLTLSSPKTSCWQILYFIGVFPKLHDLKLCNVFFHQSGAGFAHITPSKPPLQGCLTLERVAGGNVFVDNMITLYGRLRFHQMDLYEVKGMQQVLDSCAETLEKLRLKPFNQNGENVFGHRGRAELNDL